jgi:hypothetical protein
MAGTIAIALLFGAMGFYLTLIAKFYRQKFMKGPPHQYMQASLSVLVGGLFLEAGVVTGMPSTVPALLICLGGLAFSALSYRLYRTMMSRS